MIKVINGKRYNTDTANFIADYSNCRHGSDFLYVYEALYKTKSGNWFLKYSGGANSKYGVSIGNGWQSGDEGILPYTPDEAYEWLESNNLSESIKKFFPENVQEIVNNIE